MGTAVSEQQLRRVMKKRKITLEDGRYLIFFTFEDAEKTPESNRKEQKQGDG
jgi:hypothetical protein